MPTAAPKTVSRGEWTKARVALMKEEKAFTKARDALSAKRRKLPRVKVETDYVFEGEGGPASLADLFAGRSQLLVYHFMFGPDWKEGCKSCSFWADNYDGVVPHLAARDVSLVGISRAPLKSLLAFRKRMGWRFPWYSSLGNSFNYDYSVSFEAGKGKGRKNYNFGTIAFGGGEAPGVSVFQRDASGEIFHTYSCYARGLDMLNGAYHLLDLVPKGRDETGLPWPMAWVRLRDSYGKG